MRKLYFLAFGVFIILGMAGCEKATVTSQASVDTFIKSIRSPKDTSHIVYTAIHSVFSYNLIASASVVEPGGTTLQLSDVDKTGLSFYNVPADSTYSITLPILGTYVYTVTFKDKEVITYNNSLSSSTIQPPIITSLVQSANTDSVYISWKAISNAQAYQLRVTKGGNQVYFQAPFADSSTPPRAVLRLGYAKSSFTSNGSGTYTFEVDAMLFETTDYTYLQAMGSSKQNIDL